MSELSTIASALLAACVQGARDFDARRAVAELDPDCWPTEGHRAVAGAINGFPLEGERTPSLDATALYGRVSGHSGDLIEILNIGPASHPDENARVLGDAFINFREHVLREAAQAMLADSSTSVAEVRNFLGEGDESETTDWIASDVGKWFDSAPPEADWILNDLLPRGIVAVLSARGGSSKTTLMLSLALFMASKSRCFRWFTSPRPMRTLALFGEDPEAEIWRRALRILEDAGIEENDFDAIRDGVRFYCGRAEPLLVVTNGVPTTTCRYRWLREQTRVFRPDLVIVDPLARFTATDENSNSEASAFIAKMQDLANYGNCSVLLLHHVSKASGTSRGASAWIDGSRWAAEMRELTEGDAKAFRLNPKHCGRYIEFCVTKSSYSARPAPIYFERGPGGVLTEIDLHRDGDSDQGPGFLLDVAAALAAELEREQEPLTAQAIWKEDANGIRTRVYERLKPRKCTRRHIEEALNLGSVKGLIRAETIIGANRKPCNVYSFPNEM